MRDLDHAHFDRHLFSLLTQMQSPLEGRGMAWKTWDDYSFQWDTFLEMVKTLMHLKMLWTHLQHGIINVWNVYKYVVPRVLDFYVPSHFLFPTSIHSVLVNRQEVCLSWVRRKRWADPIQRNQQPNRCGKNDVSDVTRHLATASQIQENGAQRVVLEMGQMIHDGRCWFTHLNLGRRH